jgi:tetratricopeptide (TPR) repeat protein
VLLELGKIPELRVISRNSSFSDRNSQEDLRSVGNKLGVAYVLKGSVRKYGQEVRVTAQLVSAADGFQVWSGEYQHDHEEILVIQDTIGNEVANALEARFLSNLPAHGYSPDPKLLEPAVYDDYLQALSLYNQHREITLREAIDILKGVVAADPDFMRARLLLVDAQLSLMWEFQESHGSENLEHGSAQYDAWMHSLLEEVQEVLQSRPGMAGAYLLLGRWMRFNQEYDQAEQALRKALEINPSLAEAYRNLALIERVRIGPPTAAIENLRKAVVLDPYSEWARLNLASVLAENPETESEAWQVFRDAKSMLSWSPRIGNTEAILLFGEGRYADTIGVLEDTLRMESNPGAEYQLANTWYYLGAVDRARQLIPLFESYRDDPLNPDLPEWDRCPYTPPNDSMNVPYYRAYVCMTHRRWTDLISSLQDTMQDPDNLFRPNFQTGLTMSTAFSLALAYKMTGEQDLSEFYADIEQQVLDLQSDHGKIRSWKQARFNSRLLALRGDYDKAMDELDAMLAFGHLSPRAFANPVYDPVRNTPRFIGLEISRIRLVNEQRAMLGLKPLALLDADRVH